MIDLRSAVRTGNELAAILFVDNVPKTLIKPKVLYFRVHTVCYPSDK